MLVFMFPVGLYYCFAKLTDANIFIIIYGVTSIYFAVSRPFYTLRFIARERFLKSFIRYYPFLSMLTETKEEIWGVDSLFSNNLTLLVMFSQSRNRNFSNIITRMFHTCFSKYIESGKMWLNFWCVLILG